MTVLEVLQQFPWLAPVLGATVAASALVISRRKRGHRTAFTLCPVRVETSDARARTVELQGPTGAEVRADGAVELPISWSGRPIRVLDGSGRLIKVVRLDLRPDVERRLVVP